MPDTELLSQKLETAGVPHVMRRYPGLPHGFVMFSGLLKPALAALHRSSYGGARLSP